MQTNKTFSYCRDVILTALAPVIWGSTYIVTTQFLPPHRPFTAAMIRVLPAGLLLLLINPRIPLVRDFGRIFILSLLNIGLFQTMLFVAAYRLPGGLAAVLGAMQPLIVMFLIWVTEHRAPRKLTLYSGLIGVVGMAMLLLSSQTAFDLVGVLAALLGAISMATGVWLTGRWKINLPIKALTGWQLLIGGLMLIPEALFLDTPLPSLTMTQLYAYTWLSLAGALIAYGLWFRGIKRLPSVAVASLGLLSPLVAVILGWVILSQVMNDIQIIGIMIILMSVWVVQQTSKY